MEKNIKNAKVIAYKLRLISIKVTNYKLEIARKEKQKIEIIVKR